MADLFVLGLILGAVYLVLKKLFSSETKTEKHISRLEKKPTPSKMSDTASIYATTPATSPNRAYSALSKTEAKSHIESLKRR